MCLWWWLKKEQRRWLERFKKRTKYSKFCTNIIGFYYVYMWKCNAIICCETFPILNTTVILILWPHIKLYQLNVKRYFVSCRQIISWKSLSPLCGGGGILEGIWHTLFSNCVELPRWRPRVATYGCDYFYLTF